MKKTITIQDMIEIGTLRHDMHVARDFDGYMRDAAHAENEIERIYKEFNPKTAKPKIVTIDFIECPNEDCWEGCDECIELETEEMIKIKDINNSAIEEWMRAIDEEYDIESAPSGMARMRWMESI